MANFLFFLLLSTALMVGSYGGKCADELKEFQTCIELFATENPPEPPPPPHRPNLMQAIKRVSQCFTKNKCKNPLEDMISSSIEDVEDLDEDEPPPPPNGFPPESGPPDRPPPPGGPFGGTPPWMEMKKAKWECLAKIAKEDFEPTIQSCVQEEIPDWTFQQRPENDSVIFDPYGEGPMSKQAFIRKIKQMHRRPPGPPRPPLRKKRFAGPPFMRRRRGPPPHVFLHQKIANAIFDEEVCPVSSRDEVMGCLTEVTTDMHEEKCSSSPSPPAVMIQMVKMHADFCENRQTCFEKISDECKNSFWDQKWYITRCFDQHVETMDEESWTAVEEKFKECMDTSGILDEYDEEEKEADESEEEGSSSSEEEEGRPLDRFRKMKLRRCISKRFRDGPVKNPCKKVDGMYEFLMHHHHHRHHRHHRHHGPPPGGCCGGRGPPPGSGFGRHRGPPFGMGRRPPFMRGPPMMRFGFGPPPPPRF